MPWASWGNYSNNARATQPITKYETGAPVVVCLAVFVAVLVATVRVRDILFFNDQVPPHARQAVRWRIVRRTREHYTTNQLHQITIGRRRCWRWREATHDQVDLVVFAGAMICWFTSDIMSTMDCYICTVPVAAPISLKNHISGDTSSVPEAAIALKAAVVRGATGDVTHACVFAPACLDCQLHARRAARMLPRVTDVVQQFRPRRPGDRRAPAGGRRTVAEAGSLPAPGAMFTD